jgi:hypothetical protein
MAAVMPNRLAKVAIGTRWKPEPIERFDRETGVYESINPHAISASDIVIQRALLAPARKSWIEQRLDAIRARRAAKETQK